MSDSCLRTSIVSRTGNASWDNDNVGILESDFGATIRGQVAGNFLLVRIE